MRLIISAIVKEKGGDDRDLAAVEAVRARQTTFCNVDDRDDDGGFARPFVAAAGGVDRATSLADRPQAGGARVALADRIGGEQAEAAAVAQQSVSAAEEMRDEIGIACAPSCSVCSQGR